MRDWVYQRDGDEWVVYDTYDDDEYGYQVLRDKELGRGDCPDCADADAEWQIATKAAAEETERVAKEFEEQLFGVSYEVQAARARAHKQMLFWTNYTKRCLPVLPLFKDKAFNTTDPRSTGTITFRKFAEIFPPLPDGEARL